MTSPPPAEAGRHSPFTRPLFCYSGTATWTFHPREGGPEVLHQFGPNMFPVADVVPFVLAAHRECRRPDLATGVVRLAVPGEHTWRVPDVARAADVLKGGGLAPAGDLARACWLFWYELVTPTDLRGSSKYRAVRVNKKGGFDWHVWDRPDGGLDGAFTAYDAIGQPLFPFVVERGPFEALEKALTVTDRVAEFLKDF